MTKGRCSVQYDCHNEESPSRFSLLYVGTDDGLVWVSSDGYTWKKISDGLPQGLYVSRVIASKHKETRYMLH